MQIMTAPAVSQLVYLLDEAFQGTDWHSLLENLHSVTPEDWLWVPPGGQRSIRDIIQHVGGCKFMYHNHTFGDAQLTWDDPLVEGRDTLSTIAEAILWLREGHTRLRERIALLCDDDSPSPRRPSWNKLKETPSILTRHVRHALQQPR